MTINTTLKQIFNINNIEGETCSALIRNEILSDRPSMIGRFGSTEIKAVLYPKLPFFIRPIIRNRVFQNMAVLSGFFPSNKETIQLFSRLMYEDMKSLDILGSWRIEEILLRNNFPNAKLIDLAGLEPYLSHMPWTKALEGKRVLVVHPFNTTIESQYHLNRSFLFENKDILPEFKSLKTIKAIQTLGGNSADFANWFEALDFMKQSIDATDYDVAILGCGAYGFPLAAHIKRCGKKAVHLGGATQILFGIKGRRWDDHPIISKFYNNYWVRPLPSDYPKDAEKVENACYW